MTEEMIDTEKRNDPEDLEMNDTETYEHVSILEYNEAAEEYDRTPGERVIVSGCRRNTHIRDEEKEDFIKVADSVAIIELHRPLTDGEVTEWCNSAAGKLALAHWFDHTDPEEVAMS